jgi:hypothetical protein
VEGRPFLIFLPPGRPQDLEEMADLLQQIGVSNLMDPHRPIGPRLFVISQRDASFQEDRPTDFSTLKEILQVAGVHQTP